MQQPFHGAVFGAMLPCLRDLDRKRGGFDRKCQRHRAAFERPGGRITGVGEDPDHLPVFGEHLRDEPANATLAGSRRNVFEQHRPDAPTLMGVFDDKGDLGIGRIQPVISRDTDECPPINTTSATRLS